MGRARYRLSPPGEGVQPAVRQTHCEWRYFHLNTNHYLKIYHYPGENPMNKKLLSLAVAAAITAPAAALADATLYGKIHMTVDWFNIKGAWDTEEGDTTEYKGWALNKGKSGKGVGRANRLGVKGSEDLGGGLKAIYQIEFGLALANEKDHKIANGDESGLEMRDSYVGVKGDFGTVFVGRHDTPLNISTLPLEMFDDTMADYLDTLGFDDIMADNTIAYISPDWGGFQLIAATIPGSASTVDGVRNYKSDSLAEGYSLAATYGNGPWYFSAAYEVLTEQLSEGKTTVNKAKEQHKAGEITATAFEAIKDANANTADYKKYRIGLGVRDLNGFYLSAIYEKQKAVGFMEKKLVGGKTKDNNVSIWQGQIGYAFGNNMIKGMYGKNKPKDGDDTKAWAVGFDHNFSKRTKAYVLYTKVDADKKGTKEGDWKGFSLGVIHNF